MTAAWVGFPRAAPGVDEVAALLDFFDTKYRKFTSWHFWEKLTEKHDFKRSYNWVRVTLQAHDKIKPAPRRGVHRRKRPRRPMVGMLLHQEDAPMGGGAIQPPRSESCVVPGTLAFDLPSGPSAWVADCKFQISRKRPGVASGSGVDGYCRPVPRQEVVETAHGMAIDHALKDIPEVSIGLDVVEFCRGDEGTDCGPSLANSV